MPIYSYKGYQSVTGANCKGKIQADTERAARQRLRQKEKIIVASIKEETAESAKTKNKSLFSRRVSLAELAVMVRQFFRSSRGPCSS